MEIKAFANQLLSNFAELKYRGVRLADGIAKSYNYNPERNLLDQSMWDHIRSGVEAFISLYHFLELYKLPLIEEELKIALVGYVLHDLHKNPSFEKMGTSEYGLSLEDLEKIGKMLCENLDITPPPAEFLRVAEVSSFSMKMGDFSALSDEYRWTHIYHWVKLMDRTASITSIAECQEGRTVRNLHHLLQQLLPPKLTEKMKLEFHQVQEIRGMITTQLHNGMAILMKEEGFYPWLRFGDGTLYITFTAEEPPPKAELIEKLAALYFQSIHSKADEINFENLVDRSTFRCQTLAFMLYPNPEGFARLFHQLFLKASSGSKSFPDEKFDQGKLSAYGVGELEELYKRMKVKLPLDEELRAKWFYTARYFAALQRLIQRLTDGHSTEAIGVLADYLGLSVADIIQAVPSTIQSNNRRFDEAIWLAYRYLESVTFEGRPVSQVSQEALCRSVKEMATAFLQGKVTKERSMEVIDAETKIQQELSKYLNEQLVLSWEKKRELNLINERELLKKKTRSQKNICNICNRQIESGVDLKVKAPIIQDDVQVFSNRLLPKEKNVSALHWCSICAFEYVLRQVFGMSSLGDKNLSRRIYLFAVPSFQLTEEVLAELHHDLRRSLHASIHVHHSRGKHRHAWQTPFVEKENNRLLRNHLKEHFERYSEYFQLEMAERGRPPVTGDLLKASIPGNVMLFTFDCYSSSLERTREEAWMKAMTASLSLNKLYGFRMMVTEKPFLSLSSIRDIHYAVHLDAPPYKVARLLGLAGERGTTDFTISIEQANDMLYRLAYLWEIHQMVHPWDESKRTDKGISTILHQLEVHPLAGAYFFKRHLTENAYASDTFIHSCRQINEYKGGHMMGLAREIALASLALYKPNTNRDGRAFRYENLFRTIVKGIKEGRDKSELQGLVMKRLERLVGQNGGFVPVPIDSQAITHLVDLVYEDFFQKVCKSSLAKLNQKENQLADGIYFETHLERQKDFQEKEKVEV